MNKVFCAIGFMIIMCMSFSISAQVHKPVQWHFMGAHTNGAEAQLIFTATLEKGWHIYSQHIGTDGPLPTTFTFEESSDYERIGPVEEKSIAVKSYDKTFMMDIVWFAETAVFIQKVRLNKQATTIKGKVEFMVCTDEMCLPPDDLSFAIDVKVESLKKPKVEKLRGESAADEKPLEQSLSSEVKSDLHKVNAKVDSGSSNSPDSVSSMVSTAATVTEMNSEEAKQGDSLLAIFIGGFIGGLAAFLMPCIFPMVPATISFFLNRGGSRKNGVINGITYGLSIVVIYVTVGLIITVIFGSDALNDLSTNGVFNIFFFMLLVLFAASFLGAFEITLPSSWITRADDLADRKGLLGIFFMAATLSLVSFSCTGPLIGTLLVEASAMKSYLAPAVGMTGFSVALALPFTLFALFPSWMNALPKSGGWLNNVKVSLGFLELALALKFLSNVDLAYHWNWLDREVFLALWIIIFGLLGLYLLGKIKLPHDSELKYLPAPRLFLSIVTLAFTFYMIPGLWGAPLKVVSAFLPPQQTQDFDLYSNHTNGTEVAVTNFPQKKYDNIFHAPYNLNAFFDYEEGMAYARSTGKPVLIDFTGHACVNCRKMETVVWSDPRVLNRLQHDFVLVQLYVDDKTELPESERIISSFSGKEIITVGNKWSDFQASVFNTNSQPWYVLLSNEGRLLSKPQGADYNAESFVGFLDEGLKIFQGK